MRREIIRLESTYDPGKRSRLWHYKDAFTVLKEKTGTKKVKGLTLDLHRLMEDKHGKTIVSVKYAKRHNDENSLDKSMIGNSSKQCHLGFFFSQPMRNASTNTLPLSNKAGFKTKTFVKMHKLKLLQLNYVKLDGDYEDFPKNLIWLCWHGFPLKSIPNSFSLKKLIALDMRYSSLKVVWSKPRFLAELKFLNLGHSHGLVRTPNFSGLPSLERLIFKDCINLVKVDESIVNLQRLVFLNLKDCRNLKKLPRKMNMLKSLEELNLSGCSKLDELPEDLRKMESLKVRYLDEIAPNQLLSTTRDTETLDLLLPRFWHSTFRSWLSPRKGPHSISFSLAFLPHSLVTLRLANCNLSDDAFSCGLASLSSLRFLDLSRNPFYSLPDSINGLTTLISLNLEYCTRLQSLPKLPVSLDGLILDNCKSLERITYPRLFSDFHILTICDCKKLIEVEGLFKLEPLKNIVGLSNLETLESIEVALYCYFSRSLRKAPIQVLHECDISSIFLPRSKVPGCFVLKNTGPLISFRVHPLVGHKIQSLNLCTLYAFDPESYFEYKIYLAHYAKIENKTKCIRWTYEPIAFAPPGGKEEDMLWISHWNIGDELEGGDEIDVSVVFPRGIQVKMCGIYFSYKPQDKDTEETVLSKFRWYRNVNLTQTGTDTNFHCRHSYAYVLHTLYTYFPNPAEDEDFEDMLYPQLRRETCMFCEYLSHV